MKHFSIQIAQKYIDEYHKIAKKLVDKEAYEKDLEKKLSEVSGFNSARLIFCFKVWFL